MSKSQTPTVIVGEQPRPKALALGFSDSEAAWLSHAFPTVRAIQDLSHVAQIEWDVLVTKKGVARADPHLFVLGVEGRGTAEARRFGYAEVNGSSALVLYGDSTRASVFEVPAQLPPLLHRLVREQLAPAARERAVQSVLVAKTYGVESGELPFVRPFLRTSEGTIIAGSFRRQGGMAECWCLPDSVADLVPWALAARSEWHALAPDRFPEPAPWTRRPEWQTPVELELLAERGRLDQERTRLIAAFDVKALALESRIADASAAADARERALLTAQGDALKQVVMEALQELGFIVEDMDRSWPKGDHREDLRVRDPEKNNRVTLVEVRAHAKGAQIGDLMRLQGRFGPRFLQDEGRKPDRLWYVINHSLGQDPDQRELALAGNQKEVQIFAEDGGLVIDSVELFKTWKAVQANAVTPAAAREFLIQPTGRYEATSAAPATTPAEARRQ